MKTVKEQILDLIQKENALNNNSGFTTNQIADLLEMQRSNVSSILNELVKDGKLNKSEGRPVIYTINTVTETKVYNKGNKVLIGDKGSLTNALQIAKAAILYPNRHLNVLISANSGNGTTHFVYAMFHIAMASNTFSKDAPIMKVNCRYYQNNLDELDSILFGGTEDNDLSRSCFNLTKGGMLFIDNADLMNARQLSFISDFLESGIIYSSDRKHFIDCSDTFLVLSCNPANASKFNQRVPMVIELPDLKSRPLQEHLELINHFMKNEAVNAQRSIELPKDCMQALLLTDFEHNIKELEREISKACATAYVRVIDDNSTNIKLNLYDFGINVANSLVKLRGRSHEVDVLIGNRNLFIYDADDHGINDANKSKELYDDIQSQYNELSQRGISALSIQDVINNHIDNLFKQYKYYNAYDETYDVEQLTKIVSPKVIDLVQRLLSICKKELNRDIKPSVFYGLCLHVNSLQSIDSFSKRRIDNDQIIKIIKDYPKEYSISMQFSKAYSETFGKELPLEEVVIITMFLIKNDETDNDTLPIVLYIMHGRGVASSLANVTKTLTKCKNVYSYDLGLEIDTKDALQEIKELIESKDQGKGTIVIYDMGSIKTMVEQIAQETDIKIRLIYMPITMIGIEVTRKCMQENDLDYIYHSVLTDIKKLFQIKDNRKEAIITLCHTGDGGAYQLKQYIDQYSNLGMKTIALSISNRDKLIQEVLEIKKSYQVHCFVGTYDPNLFGIPFVPMSKIFENSTYDLDRVLMFEPIISTPMDMSGIYTRFEEQFHYVSVPKIKFTLPSVIDELVMAYNLDQEQKMGLFVHVACMLEKLLSGEDTKVIPNYNEIIKQFKDDFNTISLIVKPLEKKFKVIIDDNQIVVIMMIVNKKIK